VVLVDTKGSSHNELSPWFLDVPWDLVKDGTINFIVMLCITSDVDSTKSILNWQNTLGQNVKYAVVKNLKDGDDFSAYEHSKEGLDFIHIYKPLTISLNKIEPELLIHLYNNHVTLGDVAMKIKIVPELKSPIKYSRILRRWSVVETSCDPLIQLIAPWSERI
jgi:hypothetical protein